jgi:hypothetical protein
MAISGEVMISSDRGTVNSRATRSLPTVALPVKWAQLVRQIPLPSVSDNLFRRHDKFAEPAVVAPASQILQSACFAGRAGGNGGKC